MHLYFQLPQLAVRNAILVVSLSLASLHTAGSQELPPSPLERTVCGFIKEPLAFQSWSLAAGRPDDARVAAEPTAVQIEHRTRDGRTLIGFRVGAVIGVKRVGTLLIIQGNGMLADHLLKTLNEFGRLGFDAEVFDFRGYGRSNGARRLSAMISDYREIISRASSAASGRFGIYAISFGGIIAMNSLDAAQTIPRLVIDSTPSKISSSGCPAELDPVSRVPKSAANLFAITGEDDKVIPPVSSSPLGEAIRSRGGKFVRLTNFGHPYTGGVEQLSQRLRMVAEFISGNEETTQ